MKKFAWLIFAFAVLASCDDEIIHMILYSENDVKE